MGTKYVETRVYDGARTPLILNTRGNQQSLIWFKAFFWPDFGPKVSLKDSRADQSSQNIWEEKSKDWTRDMQGFVEEYATVFPDAIGAKRVPQYDEFENVPEGEQVRRFTATMKHQLSTLSLMSLIATIIIPESFAYPSHILHWMQCIKYEISTKQFRTG